MTTKDHKYYVDKLERKDRELMVYRDCFYDIMKWFNKNKKYLNTKPVSKVPKLPVGK